MRLKYLFLSLVFFSSSFIFSQSSKHNSWITDLDKNVNAPFSEKEKLLSSEKSNVHHHVHNLLQTLQIMGQEAT